MSIALNLPRATLAAAGIQPGARLAVTVPDGEYEVYYHGLIKAWSVFKQFFGKAAVDALAENPGIEAYIESDRTMGGRRIDGHTEWLRLRASLRETKLDSPLFSTPEGTVAALRLVTPGTFPTKLPAPKFKNGELVAQVLASHPQAMTLNVDAIALRKLKGGADCWYELQVGDVRLPIRPRRGIGPPLDKEVWNTPNALLFDYEAHWANERLTVMLLHPMQRNWQGLFPDWATVLIPHAACGTPIILRLAPTAA
jgi:hypothetical protein